MADGSLVRVRSELFTYLTSGEFERLTADDQARVYELLASANRLMRTAGTNELSLQEAEYALACGDLRAAMRHTRAVVGAASASVTELDRASVLLLSIDERRKELEPAIPGMLAQAERDFLAERYANAKVGLDAVQRSGVALTIEQQDMLDRYQQAILDLERQQQFTFAAEADLGMLQPGVMQRRNDQPADDEQPEGDDAQPEESEPLTDDELIQAALRIEAQSILTRADQAFANAEYNSALDNYQLLEAQYGTLLTDAQRQHVSERIAEAQLQLRGVGGDDLQDIIEQGAIIRAQAVAEFENLIAQAEDALKTGDTIAARDLIARARLTINSRRRFFSEEDYQKLAREIADQLQEIDETEEKIRQRQIEQRDRELRDRAEAEERARADERDEPASRRPGVIRGCRPSSRTTSTPSRCRVLRRRHRAPGCR